VRLKDSTHIAFEIGQGGVKLQQGFYMLPPAPQKPSLSLEKMEPVELHGADPAVRGLADILRRILSNRKELPTSSSFLLSEGGI